MTRLFSWLSSIALAALVFAPTGLAQRGAPPPEPAQVGPTGVPLTSGRTSDRELLDQFDADKNGWLNADERRAAREFMAANPTGRGRGGRGGRGGAPEPVPSGPRMTPADVESYPGVPLYDRSTLRTIFLEFSEDNWEDDLAAFYHTDVELPATMRVDGKTLSNVGVQFRGNSSFFSVSNGRKRSLSLSLDHVNGDQELEGYRTLTLLNSNSDPSFLRSVLYLEMAADYIPSVKANYVRVVINGESWGVYVNQQRYNKDFLRDNFGSDDGIRFKSSNRSRGGGLAYLGESPDLYREWYEIQTADRDASWAPLMNVIKVLHDTPADQLKAKLEPIFNVDGALRFLALDIVMMSGDGYWLHGSDFNLLVDSTGVLHVLHHDANEAFTAQGGGRGGTPPDATADPFVATDLATRPMRQQLLAVPEYRTRYLEYVRDIAQHSLDWAKVGPRIEAYRALIAADVEKDTRKIYSTEEFNTSVFGNGEDAPSADTLRGFIQQRREFLLNHPAIKALGG